jgi:hypothetical protein
MTTELKGCGWVPERAIRRVAGRVGTIASRVGTLLSPERGGIDRDPWILDQRSTEACTGHNGAEFIYGLNGEQCSPWIPWTFGRLYDGATPLTLQNVGVRTSSMLAAFRKHGSCKWEDWRPGVSGFSYHELPPALLRAEAQKFNIDAVPLYASGQALVALIVDALSRKLPCGLVVRVDKRFDAAKSDPVGPEDGGEIRGRHIITPWSFYRSGGSYVIECINSWGTDHGDSGIVRLSAERVGQAPYASVARGVS